jgi:ankyrin repeat protein
METAAAGSAAMYELLRFHDASPHAVDDQGNSVLHHAVRGGNEAIILDLVSK